MTGIKTKGYESWKRRDKSEIGRKPRWALRSFIQFSTHWQIDDHFCSEDLSLQEKWKRGVGSSWNAFFYMKFPIKICRIGMLFSVAAGSDRGEACSIFRKGECSCIFLIMQIQSGKPLCRRITWERRSEGGLDEKAKDFSSLPKFLNQGEARTCSSRFKEKETIKSQRKGERRRSLSIFGV